MRNTCLKRSGTRALSAALALLSSAGLAASRPNILSVFSDDHATQTIGGWLAGVDPTPNIDRLAAQGTLFLQSYCTNNLGGHGRAVILTGKHSHANRFRQYDDGSPLPVEELRLKFLPQVASPDGRHYARGATADVGPGGQIGVVTTQRYNDGLIAGRHKVYLRVGPGPDGLPIVPPAYTDPDATPLQIDTAEGRRLVITVPRPSL